MTESAKTKIGMLLAAPFLIAANWAFAWWASSFPLWPWFSSWPSLKWVIFYVLGATGTVGGIAMVIMVLFAPKETFGDNG